MSDPVRFLTALAQALSMIGLYGEDHPAVRRAADGAYRELSDLGREHPAPVFTFMAEEVVFGRDLLPELARWSWSGRLAEAGIERIEVTGAVSEELFARFLARIAAILGVTGDAAAGLWQDGPEGIRFGRVRLGESDQPPLPPPAEGIATLDYSLRQESEVVTWIHGEVGEGRPIPLLEAHAVVQSLSLAMHGGQAMVVPLLQLKEFDQYTTTHSMNVSVLTMALAEFRGLPPQAVRAFGLAGLLHDLGKVRIPHEILSKPGKLTPEERAVVEGHPADGARIILEGSEPLDLAAVVAYEHHRCHDGAGYPRAHYPRPPHQASCLVHVCDVYDALRTRRPYRDAWSSAQALEYIEGRSGREFDPAMAGAFADMMRQWDDRVTHQQVA